MSQQARLGRFGDFPNAEETKDMIDAVGVEIAGHHLQAATPPGVVVFGHCCPVVGREAPILSLGSEVIGRGSNLHVKVEQIGMRFHVHAQWVYTNGDVALQQQTLVVQGFDRLAQLLVAVVLQEQVNFRAVSVAIGAILGVVGEPVGVVIAELLEIFAVFQHFPLLIEGDLEIFPFGFQHLGIVDEVGFVEQGSCPFEGFFTHVIPSGIYGGKSV